jgi:hypothetical protein
MGKSVSLYDNMGLPFSPHNLISLIDWVYPSGEAFTDVLRNPVLVENAHLVFGMIYRDWMREAGGATDFIAFLVRHQQCCGSGDAPKAECAEQIDAAVTALHTAAAAYDAILAAYHAYDAADDAARAQHAIAVTTANAARDAALAALDVATDEDDPEYAAAYTTTQVSHLAAMRAADAARDAAVNAACDARDAAIDAADASAIAASAAS